MIATKANMNAHYAPDVIAYSPETHEEYSANPGDYFWMPDEDFLEDSEGNPMFLVKRQTRYVQLPA